MGASSKDGSLPKTIVAKLSDEELEAFQMWTYKQAGILPNQYHHTYEQGDTLLYPEHVQDILTIDKMVYNKHKLDAEKEKEEAERKQQKGLGQGSKSRIKGSGTFYGNTIKFNNPPQ